MSTVPQPTESKIATSTSATCDEQSPQQIAPKVRSTDVLDRSIAAGKIFVVLPAYNEEAGLPSLLEKIGKVFAANRREFQVIVVDDASTDNTSGVASQYSFRMPLTLVCHKVNQNLPGALRSGFLEAVRQASEGDVIVTMDGDDTHPPGVINALIQKISEGYDVVTASRYQPGSRVMGVPRFRVLCTYGARLLFQVLMPIPGVRDYTCGYRAYRYKALSESMDYYQDAFVSEKGFSCMADVLLKMRRFKYAFTEVPFLLRYDHKLGDSKMAVGRTVWLTLKLLAKRRFGGY